MIGLRRYSIYIHIYVYIYTMEYYSAVKKNEMLTFAAIWMDLIVLSKVNQRQILYDITYM